MCEQRNNGQLKKPCDSSIIGKTADRPEWGKDALNNFVYENKTRVCFGRGCVQQSLKGLLERYGQTVLLAYGCGSIKRNGIYEEVLSILHAAGKRVVEFGDIMPNPTYAKVQQGARLARQEQADLILAVGGGSVSDCCKIISPRRPGWTRTSGRWK